MKSKLLKEIRLIINSGMIIIVDPKHTHIFYIILSYL